MSEIVTYTVSDRMATLVLNRPEKRNAFSPELVVALTQALLRASEDEMVKVIILKASGPVFSAGADLSYLQKLQSYSYEENLADSQLLRQLFTTIYYLPKIVIAQVEGHAIAGGCGLASVCDIIFAVPEAKFGYTEVKLGFVPAIVSCFLMRKIGESKAKELLFSGDLFSADAALQNGLINFVTPAEEIDQSVNMYALKLCTEASGNALMITKQLLNQTVNPLLEKNLDLAVQINARVRESEDFKKGVAAFLKKAPAKW